MALHNACPNKDANLIARAFASVQGDLDKFNCFIRNLGHLKLELNDYINLCSESAVAATEYKVRCLIVVKHLEDDS